MPTITLETSIKSDLETCFDLSRSIDLHQLSTHKTKEKAIAGVTSGLISLNEYVTWEATHFYVRQRLTSKITAFDRPFHFRDEQATGPFQFIRHDHYFEQKGDVVLMKDIFSFQSPLGMLGRMVDYFVLANYLKRFLVERNAVIKEFAETDRWKTVVHHQP